MKHFLDVEGVNEREHKIQDAAEEWEVAGNDTTVLKTTSDYLR